MTLDSQMSTVTEPATERLSLLAPGASSTPRPITRPRFWRELAICVLFFIAYQSTSDITSGSRSAALAHALAEVRVERALGIFWEHGIQVFFLRHALWLVKVSDVYYATVHFLLPIVVLVWLWVAAPERYRRWRNAMAWLSGISLIIFVVYPVLPPRLLPARFGFVDALAHVGGAGPLDHVILSGAGNAYAAMPSLHVAWATWCAAALFPVVRRRWIRALLVADPLFTILEVLITANHLFLDVAGGLLIVVVGLGLAYVPWAAMAVATGRTAARLGGGLAAVGGRAAARFGSGSRSPVRP